MDSSYAKFLLAKCRDAQLLADDLWKPEPEPKPSRHSELLPESVFGGTRGYIEKVVQQINGCYEIGCYDACSVMMRRLLETLIVEAFEHHRIANQIKDGNDHFVSFSDLIDAAQKCSSWNLSRNTKRYLGSLKSIGDLSAHSRRFIAHRQDIDKHAHELRVVAQELLYVAGLK